MACCW